MKLATPITSCSGGKMSSPGREKKEFAHTVSQASYKSNTARELIYCRVGPKQENLDLEQLAEKHLIPCFACYTCNMPEEQASPFKLKTSCEQQSDNQHSAA